MIYKFFVALFVIVGILFGCSYLYYFLQDESVLETSSNDTEEEFTCNVIGINLHGSLYTYIAENNEEDSLFAEDAVSSESIIGYLEQAEDDESIKAIVFDVDSYGGTAVAGEEIADAIKYIEKPVISFIRSGGVSAAYWAISTSDYIFASKNSDVGSIGVTMSYLENVDKNKEEGLSYVQLSSGKFKDSGNPDKKITEEEKQIFMRDVKIIHENFISDIAENRNLSVDFVKSIADGSTVLGEKAKEFGLIDEIGGYFEVKNYVADLIGEDVEMCWY